MTLDEQSPKPLSPEAALAPSLEASSGFSYPDSVPSSSSEPEPSDPLGSCAPVARAMETDFLRALTVFSEWRLNDPADCSALLARILQRLDCGGAHPRGAPELTLRVIESGAFDGMSPGSLSPCPLLSLLERAPGKAPFQAPFDAALARPLPYRHNPAIWGFWIIQLASRMRLGEADRDAIFDALIQLPHPKPVRDALSLGLARAPEPPESSRRFDFALRALRELAGSRNREAPAAAQAFVYACDQWSSLKVEPSALSPELAALSLQAASVFGCGRLSVNSVLRVCEQAGALNEPLLAQCAQLSFTSPSPAPAGRALGALFASPAWTPEGKQAVALELCAAACKARDQALFSLVAPHADWSSLHAPLHRAFPAPFLARCEQEALRSKKITGLSSDEASPRPKPARARL